jgi:hypothetical protein
VRLIGVYSGQGMKSGYPNGDVFYGVGAAYECRVVGGTLHADHDEISEVRFMPVPDLLAQPGHIIPGTVQLWQDIERPDRWPLIR